MAGNVTFGEKASDYCWELIKFYGKTVSLQLGTRSFTAARDQRVCLVTPAPTSHKPLGRLVLPQVLEPLVPDTAFAREAEELRPRLPPSLAG